MRLIALVGVVLLVRYVPRLAAHCGVPADRALWLAVLNPLVLFHFVSGAHNDALLMGLVVAGLVLVLDRRMLPGVLLLSLALLVKAPAALALVFVVPFWAQQLTGRWRLVRAGGGGRRGLRRRGRRWSPGPPASATAGSARSTPPARCATGCPGRRCSARPSARSHTCSGSATPDHDTRRSRCSAAPAAWPRWWSAWCCSPRWSGTGFVGSLGLGFVAVVALGPVVQPWYLLWGFVLIAAGISNLRTRTAVIDGDRPLLSRWW